MQDEKVLVEKLVAGNRKALRDFYKGYYPKLVAYLSGRVVSSEDAEELAQDTLIAGLEALPTFSFRSSVWTFLVAIARHEVADYFRKRYAKRVLKLVPFVDQVYSEPLYSSQETVRLFYLALEQLHPREQRLLLWKYEEDLSVQEIARRLGVGVKAAESRLFRARQAFQLAYLELARET